MICVFGLYVENSRIQTKKNVIGNALLKSVLHLSTLKNSVSPTNYVVDV
jgi:hypothetical protein